MLIPRFVLLFSFVALGVNVTLAEDAAMESPPPYVAVGEVTEAEELVAKRYTGNVVTKSSVNLVARVTGELLRIGFEEGDVVEANQVLYELDAIPYEAAVKNAQAGVAEARAKLVYAELSYNRMAGLHSQKAISKEELDRIESEFKAAEATVLAAEALLITARDNLDKTRIRAPIRGKVGQTNYTIGNYLTPESGVIATINQLDPLRVTFAIANKDFLEMFGSEDALKANAFVRIRLADGGVYEHEGRIAFLDNQASRKTDAIRVYTEFVNPVGKLVPGSTVTVLLDTKSGVRRPVIIPSAVMRDAQSAYVYVVDENNRVERRDITPGLTTPELQFVRAGLRPGERVITDGMHKIMPGGFVEPVPHTGTAFPSSTASRQSEIPL